MSARVDLSFAAVLAASVLVITGCTAPEPAVDPGGAPSASSSPAPTPSDLVVPEPAEGELGRAVFLADGPDGVPTTSIETIAAPRSGATYVLEARCVPLGEPVIVSYAVTTADDDNRRLSAGEFTCDGTPIADTGPLDTDAPVQVAFTVTDGAWQAYARLIPEG